MFRGVDFLIIIQFSLFFFSADNTFPWIIRGIFRNSRSVVLGGFFCTLSLTLAFPRFLPYVLQRIIFFRGLIAGVDISLV